jgi:hypothetical protein
MKVLRDNSLTLAFLTLLLAALVGQSFAGVAALNAQQIADGAQQFSWLQYVTSSEFAVDVAENWQSEYLQFALYIVATVWLVQKGSSESKKVTQVGTESDKEQKIGPHADSDSPSWAKAGGWRAGVYGRSLGLLMALLFTASWFAQSLAGRNAYNAQQLGQYEDAVSYGRYITTADFWDRTLQNWQSEFLAVASMAVFSIYLRQRGSPESKIVGAPHKATALDS